jgi:hypothetical protein
LMAAITFRFRPIARAPAERGVMRQRGTDETPIKFS